MKFNLYDTENENLNMFDVEVNMSTKEENTMLVKATFGKDYENKFEDTATADMWGRKSVVSIKLVRVNEDFDDRADKNRRESESGVLDDNAPNRFQYFLEGFYVDISKNDMEYDSEKEYFKGMGHTILCWVLDMIDESKQSILLLQALGTGNAIQQERLVNYYKRIGFSTCVKLSNGSEVFSNGAVCMFAPMSSLFNKCKGRFEGKISNQSTGGDTFSEFRSFK